MTSVNLACAECCAWATELENERATLEMLREQVKRMQDATRHLRRERDDLERENAALRRRLREGGR
jgi:septal ring factor EnvC (AmiA/AmiB activator)